MRVPLAWLREYVDLDRTPQHTIDHLASLGFPVEACETPPTITGVVVGRIVSLKPHPNADRLQLCEIDIQAERRLIIATAATNVAQGQIVPVAQIGAQLPELTITPRKMRGIDSEGMLCSAAELGLPAAWFEDGILQLDASCPLGANVVDLLGLADPILEVEVTTNRPDALSLLGLARELAAYSTTELRAPKIGQGLLDLAAFPPAPPFMIELASPDVSEFLAVDIEQPPLGAGPILQRVRLAQAGIRPINAAIDITNYVLLECGHPTHLYDAAKIADQKLIIRNAGRDEVFTTLDGIERHLKPEHLVVADSGNVLCLAGIMGGSDSGIQDSTTHAILECAQFRGPRIRRGAASLGLRTEASTRFEKGLAHGMLHETAARVAYLLQAQGAKVSGLTLAGDPAPPATPIAFSLSEIPNVLGYPLDAQTVEAALGGLGFSFEPSSAQGREVSSITPPPWRGDIALPVDLIEEIARVIGYDHIQPEFAAVAPSHISSLSYDRERDVAHAFSRAGFQETMTLALEPALIRERCTAAGYTPAWESLEISNPLSADQQYMRFSLLPGILQLLQRRSGELRDGDVHFFEIGHIFGLLEQTVEERQVLWCSAYRPTNSSLRAPDEKFRTFKGKTETVLRTLLGYLPRIEQAKQPSFHPGKCGVYRQDTEVIATIGEIDPRLLAAFDLDLQLSFGVFNLDIFPQATVRRYVAGSKYPAIGRDLALLMPVSVSAARLTEVIEQQQPLVRSAHVFDEFWEPSMGTTKKSLTVRITLQRDDATLTDADADISVTRILEAAKAELGAELRQ